MTKKDMEFIGFKDKRPETIYCKRQKVMGKNVHRHAYYEIELVVKGSGTHIINGNAYKEKTGDVFIMRLTDYHEFIHDKETENWVIEIPPSYVTSEITKMMMQEKSDILVNLTGEGFKKAKSIFCMIEGINDQKDCFCDLLKQYLTMSLMLFILRRKAYDITKLTMGNERLDSIIEYINANVENQELSIDSIAAKFYLSRSYLSAFFSKNMGISLSAYLRKIRLNNAAIQLANTNKKIIEVSSACGFSSLTTFLREFKKEFGVTPSDMRRKNGERRSYNERDK